MQPDSARPGRFRASLDGRFVFANERHAQMLGYESPAALLERVTNIGEQLYVRSDERVRFVEALQEHGRIDFFEAEFKRPDGSTFWVQTNALMVDGIIEGICSEITARRMAEQALQESEARFAAFMDVSPAVAWMKNEAGHYLYVNETLRHVYRVTNEMIVGKTDFDVLPAATAQHLREHDLEVFKTGKPLETLEEIPNPDGTTHSWLICKFPFNSPSGRLTGGLAVDITTQKIAQEKLRESEERFRLLFQNSPLAICISSGDRILSVNDAYSKLFGYAEQSELVGKPTTEHIDCPCRPELSAQMLQSDNTTSCVTVGRKKDGTEFPAEVEVACIDLPQGVVTVAFIADLTEKQKLEHQLRQAQKMECVGQLAAGVAHDFNNIVQVIQGYSNLLLGSGGLANEHMESLNEILGAADRAAKLTRQLLAFSRKQMLRPEAIDLNVAVQAMLRMIRTIVGESVTVQTKLASRQVVVDADASMLDQLLLNLVVNARDAMPRGGTLQIETAIHDVSSSEAKLNSEARMGTFARLTVRDNGSGMDPAILARIFDPFFTTKEVGKGTGLGLSTVYGVVKQHLGWIEVDSSPGAGSSFKIFLPLNNAPLGASEKTVGSSARSGRGSVLVVEDESSVRELVRTILSRAGYVVVTANSGKDALKVWPSCKDETDLLLTDLVMPDGVSGSDLARQLKHDKPSLRVLYTSGYHGDAARGDTALIFGRNFLQKPYAAKDLILAIQRMLGQ